MIYFYIYFIYYLLFITINLIKSSLYYSYFQDYAPTTLMDFVIGVFIPVVIAVMGFRVWVWNSLLELPDWALLALEIEYLLETEDLDESDDDAILGEWS